MPDSLRIDQAWSLSAIISPLLETIGSQTSCRHLLAVTQPSTAMQAEGRITMRPAGRMAAQRKPQQRPQQLRTAPRAGASWASGEAASLQRSLRRTRESSTSAPHRFGFGWQCCGAPDWCSWIAWACALTAHPHNQYQQISV